MKFKKIVFYILTGWFIFAPSVQAGDLPQVELKTTLGSMVIELEQEKAPVTVENFLKYVRSGYYDNLIFHRVSYQWIIQAGGYDKDFNEYETMPPIKNEAKNGLKNVRGTIAMARTSEPDSADSQFFINLYDNSSFDHKDDSWRGYGYCVFGRVVQGMEVADAIGAVEKHEVENIGINVPIEPIIIVSARVIKE